MTGRRLAAGVALAALYVVVAQVSFRGGLVPARPLADGIGPPAVYQWVHPPPELQQGNVLPSAGQGPMTINAAGSPGYNLNTDDGQAAVIFPPDGVLPKPGETTVTVTITPLDPATLASPPAGLDYDGNAYRITAVYAKSGTPIQIPPVTCALNTTNACATIVLRYAFNATGLYRLDGQTWTPIESETENVALVSFGVTNTLGAFVAAGPLVPGGKKAQGQTGNLIAFLIGLGAIVLGSFVVRGRVGRGRLARRREGGKQRKP